MEQGDIAVTDLGAYAESLVVSQLLGSPKHVGDMECSRQAGRQNGLMWSGNRNADAH